MYEEARSSGLLENKVWWDIIDGFRLGEEWARDLSQLARMPACPQNRSQKGDLSFIVNDGIAQMAINLLPFFQHLVIKCGERGVVAVMRLSEEDTIHSAWRNERSHPMGRYTVARAHGADGLVVLKHFPAIATDGEQIISVTGAGDSLAGVLCAGIARDRTTFLDPRKLDALMDAAQEAAVLSLKSHRSVSPQLGS